MHPILIDFGFISIKTYGFLVATGFLLAIPLIQHLGNRDGINKDYLADLSFWILITGLIGARFLFILTTLPEFTHDPMKIFRINEGGFVFWGGPLAAIPFLYFQQRKRPEVKLTSLFDAMAPGLVIAHAIGRIGCLMAGCCYGKPTSLPWGIALNSPLIDIHYRGIPLHPTQIYESLSLLILCAGLITIHYHRKFMGQVALCYLMAYSILRSIIEEFRGDSIRGFVIDNLVSTSQFISICVFLLALAFYIYLSKTAVKTKPAA